MNQDEHELGWDDPIEKDGSDYTLVPAGDYMFEVVDLQRGRHTPGPNGKLPACNKATLKVRVVVDDEPVDIKHNLFLHSRCEGMLCAFFTAIGQRQHGEQLVPNWNRVIGSRGRCKVGHRKWKNSEGKDIESNDIKKFYDPPGGAQQPTPQQQQQYVAPAMPDDDIPF